MESGYTVMISVPKKLRSGMPTKRRDMRISARGTPLPIVMGTMRSISVTFFGTFLPGRWGMYSGSAVRMGRNCTRSCREFRR